MDRLDLSVYVEQVNPEADSTIVDNWQENEELALNNVVDPNTEFKVIVVCSFVAANTLLYSMVTKWT